MVPRRNLIAAGVLLLLAVILTVGTHDYTALIVGIIFLVVSPSFSGKGLVARADLTRLQGSFRNTGPAQRLDA